MALQLYSGTKLVDTTEWSCTTDLAFAATANTNVGKYQLVLDVNDMVAGDTLQIRAYEKARAVDTQRLLQEWILTGAQASPLWMGPELTLMHGWDFTLDCLAGTSITVLWSIRDTIASVSVNTSTISANAITATAINADAITAAKIAADAVTEIQAGLATPTNITAGTITTATNVTTVNGLAANVITAASIAADAITDAKVAADVTIASVTGAVGSVTGAVGSVTGAVGSVTGSVGSVTGAVGSVTGLTASNVGAIKAKTDSLTFTVANQVDVNIESVNTVTVNGIGTAGSPWGP